MSAMSRFRLWSESVAVYRLLLVYNGNNGSGSGNAARPNSFRAICLFPIRCCYSLGELPTNQHLRGRNKCPFLDLSRNRQINCREGQFSQLSDLNTGKVCGQTGEANSLTSSFMRADRHTPPGPPGAVCQPGVAHKGCPQHRIGRPVHTQHLALNFYLYAMFTIFCGFCVLIFLCVLCFSCFTIFMGAKVRSGYILGLREPPTELPGDQSRSPFAKVYLAILYFEHKWHKRFYFTYTQPFTVHTQNIITYAVFIFTTVHCTTIHKHIN